MKVIVKYKKERRYQRELSGV